MNLQLLKARQTKYVAYAILYIAVVLAAITAANVLANRYDKTYDATANKRYSLSEQTAKIVRSVKEDVRLTYFDQGTRFERAKDQLQLYANLSPRVHVEYVDADKKPQLARELGVKNYGTTIVRIGAKKEEAKSTSEEDITGAFIRALKITRARSASSRAAANIRLTIRTAAVIRGFATSSAKRSTPQSPSACCKKQKYGLIARYWSSWGRQGITRRQVATTSRSTSMDAVERYFVWAV